MVSQTVSLKRASQNTECVMFGYMKVKVTPPINKIDERIGRIAFDGVVMKKSLTA